MSQFERWDRGRRCWHNFGAQHGVQKESSKTTTNVNSQKKTEMKDPNSEEGDQKTRQTEWRGRSEDPHQ